ncbi:M20/M25/M40 family metallo-hydrolase [Ferruginibacter sp.]|uniref:M20/M25/M40 family metallo-hydrolase n=2 Tax=Ferruginibacter sp. TaxID=1940288 RepID=UPI00374D7AEC
MMKKLFCFSSFIGMALSIAAQSLSKTEQQVIKNITADIPATMQLLKESVNINSGSLNKTGVKKVGDLFARELTAMGFTVEWISLPDSLKRAGHLVAQRKGKKGKKLFLIGHLDTVFEPDMPANPFTILNDSTATGQGVNDMKGGDVLVIAALKALHKQGLLNDATITVYFTGDEENAGQPVAISRADFIYKAMQHDIALAFEGAVGLDKVATARRGASEWKLEVEARQAHSSNIFGTAGYGSVYEAARIINQFREQLSNEQYLTFNPALFLGGSDISYNDTTQKGFVSAKTNIIAPRTVVMGDLRFLTEEQKENARAAMQQIVAQHLAGTNATISFRDGIPSMPPTTGNEALVKIVNEVSMALQYGEVKAGDPGSRGAGDISYVANYVDCLDGLGVSGNGAHAPGETINLYQYPKLIKRTALLIYRLTR